MTTAPCDEALSKQNEAISRIAYFMCELRQWRFSDVRECVFVWRALGAARERAGRWDD